jgi:outer membrane protein TolC
MWVLSLATAACCGGADAPENRPISLEECLQLALRHNLSLQITRLSPELSRYALEAAYAAYDPTFRASVTHSASTQPRSIDSEGLVYPSSESESDSFTLGLGGQAGSGLTYSLGGGVTDTHGLYEKTQVENANGNFGFTLTQPLLKNFWIDGARYSIAVSRKDLRVSELTLQQQIMQVVTDVEVAYYGLIAAVEFVNVQEEALREAEQQLRENRKRVEVGVMAPLEEKDAESQVAASRANLIEARRNLETSQNRLKALITDRYADFKNVLLKPTERLSAAPQPFDRLMSWTRALTYRPDMLRAKVELEKRNIRLRYDYNQLFPQLDVTGGYRLGGSGVEFARAFDRISEASSPSYSFGAILSMPLSNRQARSAYRSSKVDREQSLLQLKKLEQDIMVQIDDAIAEARSSLEQVQARRQAALYADEAYKAEQKRLENGKSTSFQVLVLQRVLNTRRYEEIMALGDYNRALANLALAEGSSLERRNILFEVR